MRFSDLFKNRKNTYFVSMLIIVTLVAGGVWQYHNYTSRKMAELDFENQLNELDKLLDDQSELGIKAVESNTDIGDSEDTLKEVANTNVVDQNPKKPSDVKGPTAKANTTKDAAKAEAVNVNIDTMILPVFGNISAEYSDTELIYSKTIDSWITHTGLDIRAEEGSTVRAALDGTVADKYEDPQWGMTIVLDHGSDVYTKYSNLSTLELVSKGQQIKKGDVISGVGKTAICEIADEPHLHFELIRDNQNINPKNYLPKSLK